MANGPYAVRVRLVPAESNGRAALEAGEDWTLDSIPGRRWRAHRPLGDVQRARKVVYFESQKGRGAA